MRQFIMVNLPWRFATAHSQQIDDFLDTAKPGDTLLVYCGAHPEGLNPWVSQTYVERHTAELRLREGTTSRTVVLEPADEHAWQVIQRSSAGIGLTPTFTERPRIAA
jgi:hypothetical protein